MYQAPAQIWNQVAKQPLRTRLAKRMFPLSQDKLMAALQREEDALIKDGTDPLVASVYLMMAPLLWEQKAISKAGVNLTPVVAVDEAVRLAANDYPLTEFQKAQLAQMLATEPM